MSVARIDYPLSTTLLYNRGTQFPTITGSPMVPNLSMPPSDVGIQDGGGIINWAINNLPREMHLTDQGDDGVIRKSNFTGPGTKLDMRLARGDVGINALDRAAMQHDIFYRDHRDASERHKADLVLAAEAQRIANDPKATERQKKSANLVAGIMHGKVFFGSGEAQNKSIVDIIAGLAGQGINKFTDYKIAKVKAEAEAQKARAEADYAKARAKAKALLLLPVIGDDAADTHVYKGKPHIGVGINNCIGIGRPTAGSSAVTNRGPVSKETVDVYGMKIPAYNPDGTKKNQLELINEFNAKRSSGSMSMPTCQVNRIYKQFI